MFNRRRIFWVVLLALLLPLAALELDWQDGCLQAELTDADGTVRQLLLCLRSGEEAGA